MRDRPALRIGDVEREGAVILLREHHVAGRLDVLEFQQRMTSALQARTAEDLAPLFADLPRLRSRRAERPRGGPLPFRTRAALVVGGLVMAGMTSLALAEMESRHYQPVTGTDPIEIVDDEPEVWEVSGDEP